jgi:archaellum biogenesis protein FlaJ (TadC family)
MGLLKDVKKAYNEGYESTAGMQKNNSVEHPKINTNTEQPNIDESVNENSEKRNEINRRIRSIFLSLLGTFVFLLVGIFVFSFFSAKGNTGLMILGIPIAIFPVIIGYFRSGSITAILKDSLNEKPEEYLDSQGRRRKRDTGSGFAGMIISLLILMIAGIFITIVKIVILLFKWLIVAIQSKGRAFINPYNVPLLCIVALIGLLVVLNLTNPGMVSFEF